MTSCQYETVEILLYEWGNWRNKPLRRGTIKGGSTWHTIATGENRKTYWQPCQLCLESGIDLSTLGSGILPRAELERLRRDDDLRHERGVKLCGACNGRKGHHVTAPLADPNAIPRTGPGGMQVPLYEGTPQEFVVVEDALAGMGEVNYAVVVSRYVIFPRERSYNPGADGRAARVAWVNERVHPKTVTEEAYKKRLTAAKRRLSEIFGIPVRKEEPEEKRAASEG